MNALCLGVAFFLMLNLVAGLNRTLRGPTAVDRLVTAQFFNTKAVAVLLLFAQTAGVPAFRDVALIFVLLAAIGTLAFIRLRLDEGDGD